MVAALFLLRLRDLPRNVSKNRPKFFKSLRALPLHLKENKTFARVNIIQLIAGISAAVIPLSILFCKNSFGLSTYQVSTLIYLQIAGSLAGGLVWGNISHRFGNKYVVMLSQILSLLLHISALLCILVIGKYTPFALLGFIVFLAGLYSGNWLGFSNYIIDVSTEGLRSVYILINSMFTLPATLLYYLAGLAAGQAGFAPLYTTAAAAALIAFILSLRLKSPQQIAEMKVKES